MPLLCTRIVLSLLFKSLGPQGSQLLFCRISLAASSAVLLLLLPLTHGEEGISELFQNLTRILGVSSSPCLFSFFKKPPKLTVSDTREEKGRWGGVGRAFQDQVGHLLCALPPSGPPPPAPQTPASSWAAGRGWHHRALSRWAGAKPLEDTAHLARTALGAMAAMPPWLNGRERDRRTSQRSCECPLQRELPGHLAGPTNPGQGSQGQREQHRKPLVWEQSTGAEDSSSRRAEATRGCAQEPVKPGPAP